MNFKDFNDPPPSFYFSWGDVVWVKCLNSCWMNCSKNSVTYMDDTQWINPDDSGDPRLFIWGHEQGQSCAALILRTVFIFVRCAGAKFSFKLFNVQCLYKSYWLGWSPAFTSGVQSENVEQLKCAVLKFTLVFTWFLKRIHLFDD